MTKVDKKTKAIDMQTHIRDSFEFINSHLPVTYVDKVMQKLTSVEGAKGITKGVVRNVRTKGVDNFSVKNLHVLTALLEVAKENKKMIDDFVAASSNLNSDDNDGSTAA